MVQLFRTAAVLYRVNNLVDIPFKACGVSFGAFGTFGRPLFPLGSHWFPLGHHCFPLEPLFSIPLRLMFERHFQNHPLSSCHVQTITISIWGPELYNIIVNQAIFVFLTSEVSMAVVIEVIIIIDFGLRLNCSRTALSCGCHCLQSVINLMDGSDAQLSSGELLWRHVFW